MDIIEYDTCYAEEVKDLLVELQSYLASLDKRGVLVLKDNYRDGYFAYVLGEIKEHSGEMFLAQDNDKIIGLIVCKIFQGGGEENFTTSCPKIGFISDLIVKGNMRGKGVGKALLNRAEEYFKRRDCEYSQLEVFAPNIGAYKLY